MELVTVKTKYQIVIPQNIREEVGLKVGDLLEARVERGSVTFTPKTIVDRRLAEGLDDIKHGRTHGPYGTVQAARDALEARAKRIAAKRRK